MQEQQTFFKEYHLNILDKDKYKFDVIDKSNFFPDKITENIIKQYNDFLYKLGFNLSKTRKQGQIRRNTDANENLSLTWTQFSEFEIEQQKCFYKNDKWRPINTYSVAKHQLSAMTSNRKSSLSKSVYDLDEKFLQDIYKLECTYGISRHPKSNILMIDYDNHKDNKSEETIKKDIMIILRYFDCPSVLYIEKSNVNGIHMFLQFNRVITDTTCKRIKNILKDDYNIDIECMLSTQIFRLPCSATYLPCTLEYNEDYSSFDLIPYDSFESLCDKVESAYELIDYNFYLKEETKTEQTVPKSSWQNVYNKESNTEFKQEDLYYGYGERVEKWYRKGYGFLFYKMSNFDESAFSDIIHQYNIDSKDMKDNPEKCISDLWNFCEKNYAQLRNSLSSDQESPFISNIKYSKIEDFPSYYKILATEIYNHDKKNISRYKKNRKNSILEIEKVLVEIYGRIIFEKETDYKRVVSKNALLTKETRKIRENSIQFDLSKVKHIKNLKKYKKMVLDYLCDKGILSESGKPCSLPGIESLQSYSIIEKIKVYSIEQMLIFNLCLIKIKNSFITNIKKFKSNITLQIYNMLLSFIGESESILIINHISSKEFDFF